MKIKVCGLTHINNLRDIANLGVDYFGLIFYAPSARCIYRHLSSSELVKISEMKNTVAVFVNEDEIKMKELARACHINTIQLHGNECPELCKRISEEFSVIKAISVGHKNDFAEIKNYVHACDYFLFDTKTPDYGGSGKKFNWNLLDSYHENIPFFLSGGIHPDDAATINSIAHPMLYGIDLNSQFEIKPGIKDTSKLKKFINHIKR